MAPPTGTTVMPLLCADICTTQQTVSDVKLPTINLYAGKIPSSTCICTSVITWFAYIVQGQFPCPLDSLGEAMPQYWLGILDVLVESRHSSNVHPATTPSPLTTLMAFMYIISMFNQLNISCYI